LDQQGQDKQPAESLSNQMGQAVMQ
jgi:hypothetical protein